MADLCFQRIGLVGQRQHPKVAETLDAVHDFLTQLQLDITVCDDAHSCQGNELIIVVGGDGSLLRAARYALANDIPILGINRGRLGFLTDIAPDECEHLLLDILQGQFVIEERLLLETVLVHNEAQLYNEYAINDIVLKQGNVPAMLAFDIYIGDNCVAEERADGIIVATPTGSTAYALSGGGPILHPGLNAYLLLSMYSHTLSNRPIVIPGSLTAKLKIGMDNSTHALFRCDGLEMVAAPPGSEINIQPADKMLRLMHPCRYNYFDNLRGKLSWGK